MKKIVFILIALPLLAFAFNEYSINKPVNSMLSADSRNKGIEISVSYQYFINTDILVYKVENIDEKNSVADVMRTLFQVAESLKDKNFSKVYLANNSGNIFYLKGEYFKQLGNEYNIQKPVYLLRMLPENTYQINGEQAYPSYEGGLIAVVTKQMENLNILARKWFIEEKMSSNE